VDRVEQIKITKDQSILESTINSDPIIYTINALRNPSLMDRVTVEHLKMLTMQAQEKIFREMATKLPQDVRLKPNISQIASFGNQNSAIMSTKMMEEIKNTLGLDQTDSQVVNGLHDFNFKQVEKYNLFKNINLRNERFAQDGPEFTKLTCEWEKVLPDWTVNILPDEICYSKG